MKYPALPSQLAAVFAALTLFQGAAQADTSLYIPPMRELIKAEPTEVPANINRTASDPVALAYVEAVARKIERVPGSWPRDESGNHVYGDVWVMFTVGSDGGLLDISTRGNQFLAEELTDRFKRAAPFSPPSESLMHGQGSAKFSRQFTFARINKARSETPQPQVRFMPAGPPIRVR